MATELVKHANPAVQVRTGASPAPEIDLEVRHPYVPWRFRNFTYKRDFAGATTLTFTKKFAGDQEAVITTLNLVGAQDSAFFDLDIELGHEESVHLVSSGAAPAGAEKHAVSVVWEERRDQVG